MLPAGADPATSGWLAKNAAWEAQVPAQGLAPVEAGGRGARRGSGAKDATPASATGVAPRGARFGPSVPHQRLLWGPLRRSAALPRSPMPPDRPSWPTVHPPPPADGILLPVSAHRRYLAASFRRPCCLSLSAAAALPPSAFPRSPIPAARKAEPLQSEKGKQRSRHFLLGQANGARARDGADARCGERCEGSGGRSRGEAADDGVDERREAEGGGRGVQAGRRGRKGRRRGGQIRLGCARAGA